MLIAVFPHTNLNKCKPLQHNTTICCRAKVTQLGGYVIVDVGGKYVTFHMLNIHINIKKIITPRFVSLRQCVKIVIDSRFVHITPQGASLLFLF